MSLSGAARKRKGARQELRCVHLLEAIGYNCCKAGGSLGLWDVIASNPAGVKYIQVKSNRKPGSAEMESLREFRAPPGCTKEVWVYHDGEKYPSVEVL